MQRPQRILFVCLGNTCRSPMAEGMFRHLAQCAGLSAEFRATSAGTRARSTGTPPDPRACAAMRARSLDISNLRTTQLSATDLAAADLIVAMDGTIRRDVLALLPADADRPVHLLLDFAPGTGLAEVADPFAGSAADYEHALDLIASGCAGLLRRLRPVHSSPPPASYPPASG